MAQWLDCEFADRKTRDSNPISASRRPLSWLGQPDSIPALVLPSGGMAARYRKGVTAERLLLLYIVVKCCRLVTSRIESGHVAMQRIEHNPDEICPNSRATFISEDNSAVLTNYPLEKLPLRCLNPNWYEILPFDCYTKVCQKTASCVLCLGIEQYEHIILDNFSPNLVAQCLFVPLDGAVYHEFDLGTIGSSICWHVSHKPSVFGFHVAHPPGYVFAKSIPLHSPRKITSPSSDTFLRAALSMKRNRRCSLAILKCNTLENMELFRLFVQNSASEQPAGRDERIEANDLVESFPIQEPSASDVRVTVTSSLVSVDSGASQKMSNSRASIVNAEKGRSGRQSLASICGIDVPCEELENLSDVPLEFAMAELFLRRAVKPASVENKGYPAVARLESRKSETVPETCEEKRLSVAPRTTDKLRPEQHLSLVRSTGMETDGMLFKQKTPRASLCKVHLPQRPLFIREQETTEEPSIHLHDIGSKITMSWATVDSTEITNGLKMTNLPRQSSNSDIFDQIFEGTDNFTLPEKADKALQVSFSLLKSNEDEPRRDDRRQSHLGATTSCYCGCYGSLHGKGSKRDSPNALQTNSSLTSSTAAGLLRKLRQQAFERTKAKSERLPFNSTNPLFATPPKYLFKR
ncbi:hypothetical protein CSKR_108014 [Clonorchis sinensis]|uniref:Uncharacterized protein n=1 Tax=Clonorchis sinensis TaxID=79923 RepID=A0A419Q6S6_CLOSI|nr:hypothetical protein CSKR_108014 [Clonorchis sinensis]